MIPDLILDKIEWYQWKYALDQWKYLQSLVNNEYRKIVRNSYDDYGRYLGVIMCVAGERPKSYCYRFIYRCNDQYIYNYKSFLKKYKYNKKKPTRRVADLPFNYNK